MNLKRILILFIFLLLGFYFLISLQEQGEINSLVSAEVEALREDSTEQKLGIDSDKTVSSSNYLAAQSSNEKPRNIIAKYKYEDDWCVAFQDLNEGDFFRAKKEQKEWNLKRGIAFISAGEAADFEPMLNNEYVESYQELDQDVLIELAKQDDRMALITLVQLQKIDRKIKTSAARQLVILGDTSGGLQLLVNSEMLSARFRYADIGEADEKVKKDLLDALVLVEYGLQQLDVSALNNYLLFIDDVEQNLGGLNPDQVLSETELASIAVRTQRFTDFINSKRGEKNLPPLDELDIPHIAYATYRQELAISHGIYPGLLDNQKVFQNWTNSYLHKTSCLKRLVELY